jgi:hypothetical protein
MTAIKANLQQTIERLTEAQLQQVIEYIAFLQYRDKETRISYSVEHRNSLQDASRRSPAERAASFLQWARSHQPSGVTLPDEAFSRENIYAE